MDQAASLRHKNRVSGFSYLKRNWDLYLLLVPVAAYFIIFKYIPMYGVQIAFKNFIANKGIWGSPWVGAEHFNRFFSSYYFKNIVTNTLGISLYALIAGFPVPILLALMLNEVRHTRFKKAVQTVTYAPHFISMVVMCSMIILFLSPQAGFVNRILKALGFEGIYFMGEPAWFKTIYVFSGIWQNAGWSSIIYMAALAGIDPQLHEAAIVDGAGRLRRIWHINIPGILPTAVILLILNSGQLMSVGFEKVFLLQNDLNRSTSDVISTFVYRVGLIQRDFSFSTAVNLFNSVINMILLVLVNTISRRVGETSLW
jgi:putative aldouronate transport system permease protein